MRPIRLGQQVALTILLDEGAAAVVPADLNPK
jgi:hypothetical protein